MRTLSLAVVLSLAACAVAAPVPAPTAREAAQLIEKLGSNNFAEREAATKRLGELGELALDALRAACRSENPEVADRAKDLVRTIERRVASDRLLAPTVVDLSAKDTPLDGVLAALSKQAGCEVVLGGLKAEELAAKKVTLATGKVPFWAAVLKVCDAGGLQVAGAGGFLAPGAMPYRAAPGTKIRTAGADRAVVLEARGEKRRPASVHGAVLVEAFETPNSAQPSTLLQIWPEPRLAWQSIAHVKLTKSLDGEGRRLTPDPALPAVRTGGSKVIDPRSGTATVREHFAPNARQAVLKFKPGEWAPRASELSGTAFGLVRSPAEPLAAVALKPNQPVTATGPGGVSLTATERAAKGKRFVEVKLSYDGQSAVPARSDELTHAKIAAEDAKLIHGLRVTDADGRPFDTALASAADRIDRLNPRRVELTLRLELVVAKDGPQAPAKVTFWGTTPRPVEVPFTLKDVPLR